MSKDAVQDFFAKHEHEGTRSHVTYHVAKVPGPGVMVFLDCRQCGAGSGTSMPKQDAAAIEWPDWARPR